MVKEFNQHFWLTIFYMSSHLHFKVRKHEHIGQWVEAI